VNVGFKRESIILMMNFYSRSRKVSHVEQCKKSRRKLKAALKGVMKDLMIEQMKHMRDIAMKHMPLRILFSTNLQEINKIERAILQIESDYLF
jgi:hypothetical protein